MNKKVLILTLALALPASLTLAQRPGGGPPPPPPGGPGGPGGLPPLPPPGQGGGSHPHGNRPPKDRPEKPPLPQMPPMPLRNVLDGDHDGIISAKEIEAAPDALSHLDKNRDGKLTPDEFFGQRPDGPPPGGPKDGAKKPADRPFPGQKPDAPKDGDGKPQRPPPPPLIGALDADGDGVISAGEIADSSKALLTLDKNGDGQLGPVELMGHPPGDNPPGDGPKPPRPPKPGQ